MNYTQITEEQTTHMLGAIGVGSIDDLFRPIPEPLRLGRPLDIPKGLSEQELLHDIEALACKNHATNELVSFLGAGAYDHFIPTVVDAIAGQTEFLTAYTPYQAEASQGVLQLFFEFQTMVCMLSGMEVANASLYEGATAVAEAATMASGITRRRRIAVAESVHPDTVSVIKSYALERDLQVDMIPAPSGVIEIDELNGVVTDQTAGVIIQSPNFYGCIEPIDQIISEVHESGALAIVSWDPISSGLLRPPGALGADIVVAEGQPLGIPLQYGGPYLGLMACREKYLRKMPGRVVGLTRDATGRRGYCLTLQTREQHIKRERATSNICTNQGLLAVRASAYMAAMGKNGIANVARLCFDKAHYAADQVAEVNGFELRFPGPFFKEFVVRTDKNVDSVLESCRARGVLAGVSLKRFDSRLSDSFMVAVTEKRTRAEIDALVLALAES